MSYGNMPPREEHKDSKKSMYKRNVLLERGKDCPIMKIDNPVNYIHMLKAPDFDRFASVCTYLTSRGVTPYLGGSVPEGWMLNGKKEYNDIDLIAVADDNQRMGRLLKTLIRSDKTEDPLKMGKFHFYIDDVTMAKSYVNVFNPHALGGQRFNAIPVPSKGELIVANTIDEVARAATGKENMDDFLRLVIRPANIDITVVQRNFFEESLRR